MENNNISALKSEQISKQLAKSIEIMAPAGNFECLHAAIQGGADSVYFGVEKLNMRSHSANNFKMTDRIYEKQRFVVDRYQRERRKSEMSF